MKELLECPICKKQFQTLNSHIHFKHKLSTEEFLKQYPNTRLVSDSLKTTVSESCKKSGCGKWIKGYKYPDWRIKQYQEKFSGEKNPFYGKKHTDKTRRLMSDNHADFTGDKNPLVNWLNRDPHNREIYSQTCKNTWKDPKNYRARCEMNRKNIVTAMLNGNHNPYSKCKCGWLESKKFGRKYYYQSSYEKKFLDFCEQSDKIKSLQRLPFVIPYIDDAGNSRNYYADFLVNTTMVVEIKPKSMLDYNHNRQKIDAGKKYCLNNGYEYKLLMECELNNLDNIL